MDDLTEQLNKLWPWLAVVWSAVGPVVAWHLRPRSDKRKAIAEAAGSELKLRTDWLTFYERQLEMLQVDMRELQVLRASDRQRIDELESTVDALKRENRRTNRYLALLRESVIDEGQEVAGRVFDRVSAAWPDVEKEAKETTK